jgi:hypothetical protein
MDTVDVNASLAAFARSAKQHARKPEYVELLESLAVAAEAGHLRPDTVIQAVGDLAYPRT